jgi:hypothetical protein
LDLYTVSEEDWSLYEGHISWILPRRWSKVCRVIRGFIHFLHYIFKFPRYEKRCPKVQSWTELNWNVLNWTELNWTELNWTEVNWTELNWTELNWTEPNWTELNWTDLYWTELNWTELKCTELNWIELNLTDLNWTEPNWTELNWTELNWQVLHNDLADRDKRVNNVLSTVVQTVPRKITQNPRISRFRRF